jgi:hypothetical protein
MELDEDDDHVFSAYGRAMLAAQMLEFEVFELANLVARTPQQFEQAMRKIETRLAAPSSRLAKDVAALPESLKHELLELLDVRHKLAHSFLMEYRIKKVVEDDAISWALELLGAAFEMFCDMDRRIEVVTRGEFATRGLDDDLTEEEEEAVLESMRRWSRDEEDDEEPGGTT